MKAISALAITIASEQIYLNSTTTKKQKED